MADYTEWVDMFHFSVCDHERLPLPVCTANDECLGASASTTALMLLITRVVEVVVVVVAMVAVVVVVMIEMVMIMNKVLPLDCVTCYVVSLYQFPYGQKILKI
ncbi:hypothetical protein DPMN_136222 [Dreissena polymorpha]|uniref:Uncharacterized protein n=1 Tax=Dreissena polymorpha TaxID=45954 RepID=A0A9D4JDK4_DREPO|nr:hypothetical protein DPMN_136222 [Dreissena polymorpha]